MNLLPLVPVECNDIIERVMFMTTKYVYSLRIFFSLIDIARRVRHACAYRMQLDLKIATADKFCLACGKVIGINDQRKLCSESASDVYKVWRGLFVERLKDKDMDMESVFRALGHTCTCRNCFKSMEIFCEKKNQFLGKLDAAIKKIPNTSRIISGL